MNNHNHSRYIRLSDNRLSKFIVIFRLYLNKILVIFTFQVKIL